MEMRLVSKTADKMEIEFIGENDTILNLLKQKLLQDPTVGTATYIMGHPYLDNPLFVLETKGAKPEQALKNAAKELRQAFDEFETQLVRATEQRA